MNYIYDLIYQFRGYISILFLGSLSYFLYMFSSIEENEKKLKFILQGNANKIETKIINKKIVTHDTILLELKLPNENDNFGLPIGNNIRIYTTDNNGNEIFRNYTPISKVNKKGSFSILLKVYHPNEKFPKGGILSQYLNNLYIGDKIFIKGPYGNLIYKKNKNFEFNKNKTKKYSNISLVGGGTGITPLYQLIKHIVEEDKFDNINLIFANKTENDILLKNELKQLNDSNLVNVNFCVDISNNKDWKGYVGYIKKEWLEKSFPEPSNNHLVCVCGPQNMTKKVKNQLIEIGHDLENIFIF